MAGLLQGINKVANPKNKGRAFNCIARRDRHGVGITEEVYGLDGKDVLIKIMH